ncbi:uncharacterized protein LOC6593831 isoform X2 [Drosophila persimilis]|uniref:uncharacterized protein LOC6593831 isoform X2 n=1 Tax=Drosophila persimilis TaxID=7234 RepID=UPI000F0991F0|nr:uncharacterized protein LOC6593831 isoform X2 [Drosophila persimilis]
MGNNVSNAPFIHRRIKRWASTSRRRTYVPYALPQTESYPIYLRQTETYPINTETYSRQAEVYPRPMVSEHDRSALLARSKPNEPSSSFDLAVNSKDFDYGNQRRGYADY